MGKSTKRSKASKSPAKKPETKSSAPAEETPAVKSGRKIERGGDDAGVPMLAGSAAEPQGPEDALGEGKKRGDYSGRQDGAVHMEARPIEGGGGPVVNKDGGIDNAPISELVGQNDRVEQIGDVAGEKGGVTTA